jgi:exodeoxyribonuclease-5
MSDETLTICSTVRLAWAARRAHDLAQRAAGHVSWQPLKALTLGQWLDDTLDRASLSGEIGPDTLPACPLGDTAELLLWERAIKQCLDHDSAQPLFDIAGMARTAAEAHALMLAWRIPLPSAPLTEETHQFLRWRETFLALCRSLGAVEVVRLREMQIDALQQGVGTLPARMRLLGFDRLTPQEQRLIEVLRARGVEVDLGQAKAPPAEPVQLACDDADAECRAAVGWALSRLTACPQSRLAIVVPELGTLRARLVALLDDVLHPETVPPSHAEAIRRYDISLGEPLARQPLVACALALIRLATGGPRLLQEDFSPLLRNPYWSAAVEEADARARLELRMRRKLPLAVRMEQLIRFADQAGDSGLPITRLRSDLHALHAEISAWPRRQHVSAWVEAFRTLLVATGWPGERSLSSHEFQARRAWDDTLAEFSSLDDLLGAIDAREAAGLLARMCRDRIFQPQARADAQILVMGMLEASAVPLDAVWVMGMNDHLWPPPARPNPVLPTSVQRAVGTPHADARVQADFAQSVLRRILSSAPEVIMSWSRREGERTLRPSPLLHGVAPCAAPPSPVATLAERLAAQPAAMQWLDDHMAPALAPGEEVHGGTGILRAQAVCPAWAYFRYRLGARALEAPVEGLDAMARGNLLHEVLQCFWQGRDSAWLHAMDAAGLHAAIAQAVEQGVHRFCSTLGLALPPAFLSLEKRRLHDLLAAWLAYEKTRPPFVVEDCECEQRIDIAGVALRLVLDRIDRLPDGRCVVLDYKTGSKPDTRSWAEDRITEPQLPIYAAFALSGQEVAAVGFAKVRADEQKFIGVAAETGVLPDVKGLAEARALYPETRFADWGALVAHWRERIQAIATEFREGQAAVRFSDEDDLRHCEVLPLLRLPERKVQLEREGQSAS